MNGPCLWAENLPTLSLRSAASYALRRKPKRQEPPKAVDPGSSPGSSIKVPFDTSSERVYYANSIGESQCRVSQLA